jgi:hypothetical protein
MMTKRLALVAISPIVLALAACGNDDTPASTVTALSGQVVKGPVGGSTVCAYAITGGVKATATVVPCVTSDPITGNYSLGDITYVGDMIVEASGGTYKDEATGATLTLSSPLKTMVVAQGGATTGMITPLTTIALSTTPNLNNTAFGQAAANVAAQAGLSAVNILTTAPTYGSNGTTATNAYAAMLGAISQYQKTSGGTLAAALAAWTTPANQAAFQAALNAYATAASVLAANLPSALNFAATGTAYSFAVSSGAGSSATTVGGGLASTGFTLTGPGAGFSGFTGILLDVAGMKSVTFISPTLTPLRTLYIAIDSSGTTTSYTVNYNENDKQWKYNCKGSACASKVVIDNAKKTATLTDVTMTADTTTGASGTIVASGSGTF